MKRTHVRHILFQICNCYFPPIILGGGQSLMKDVFSEVCNRVAHLLNGLFALCNNGGFLSTSISLSQARNCYLVVSLS